MNILSNETYKWHIYQTAYKVPFIVFLFLMFTFKVFGQIEDATQSGFTWISTENIPDSTFGSGYTMYCSAWPIFKQYPGSADFQTGLSSSWLTTQKPDNQPSFYTTIEGGLGWWHDTRFGTKIPKFIMGGVSYNFHSWANGPGAGQTDMLPNGQRDWSKPGGKYGVAQLSNKLLWAPDGLNMAQSLNGEMLGYGYIPLPLTDPLPITNGKDIKTGNQCWTLFLNATNFKGPATFFLPTFWTDPVLLYPELEGLMLDTRPSDPNVGFGVEHAVSPAIIARDVSGKSYAKVSQLQYPSNNDNKSMILKQISVYSKDALWHKMESWFDGGPPVVSGINPSGVRNISFVNNGGSMTASIKGKGTNSIDKNIDLNYIRNIQLDNNIMGFEYDLNRVEQSDKLFKMPEYFVLDSDSLWRAVDKDNVPTSTNLVNTPVPVKPRPAITYLTPLESDCHWQGPNNPWKSPGPVAGPFTQDLGDGSTVTYYWYRFIDQPSIINANLPEDIRNKLQQRVELIHTYWKSTDEYIEPINIGRLATLDPATVIEPPKGLEVGYVPIVTRQEQSKKKVNVFVLAGQSNMEGYGAIYNPENAPGTLKHVVENDTNGIWSDIGQVDNWTILDDAYLYYEQDGNIIKSNVTVGQGANSNLIGTELAFAHQMDKNSENPILLIKTAWGGKSLAEDFRPPSAGGIVGPYYKAMIDKVHYVLDNLEANFPDLGSMDAEISGFVWFQGWNDGGSEAYLNEYESNLNHLIKDVRNDFKNPKLPFIIASAGQGGYEVIDDSWVQNMQNIVAEAQEAVGCDDLLYGGRVGFVNSKPFYLNQSVSPEDAIYHYNNNALTFLNIGKAMGDEMILAMNDMSFCYQDCANPILPNVVSIGNRVWNDLNRNGINEPNEPGIPGVSLVIWSDSDGDGIPDWMGFGGVRITDENGYYRFSGLKPGKYVVFVWQVNNWGVGEPLEHFVSTNGYQPNADNDIDFDNNGFGNAFSDIMSGIVTLGIGEEPLDDGDEFNCYFNYDANGNNTIDFGFYNPKETSSYDDSYNEEEGIQLFPTPARDYFEIKGAFVGNHTVELYDSFGRRLQNISLKTTAPTVDISSYLPGLYYVKVQNLNTHRIKILKLIKI